MDSDLLELKLLSLIKLYYLHIVDIIIHFERIKNILFAIKLISFHNWILTQIFNLNIK
jgi:hypothetical protein